MSARVVIKNVKTRPADYMRCVLMRFMARYGIFFALPVAACLVLGVVNINFVIVALMLTFVAAPMALTIVYINYGLTAESRWSVLEKDIEITNEGINLTFTDETLPPRCLAWSEFMAYRINKVGVVLEFASAPFRYFVIPASALIDKTTAQRCIELIALHLTRK